MPCISTIARAGVAARNAPAVLGVSRGGGGRATPALGRCCSSRSSTSRAAATATSRAREAAGEGRQDYEGEENDGLLPLLPYGALTSKPYAFQARPWELRHAESIDVSDGIGSNIRVDFKETEVMRVLPRENEDINSEWIHDKARFSYDGLKRQRLDRPYASVSNDGEGPTLSPVTWTQAFGAVRQLTESPTAFVLGRGVDLEAAVAVKDLAAQMDSAVIYKEGGCSAEHSPNYLKLTDVDEADMILLVGFNPRFEATMLNVRIRQRFLKGGMTVATVGAPVNLTYDTVNLGLTPSSLRDIANGSHPFCEQLAAAEKPLILYGSAVLERDDSASIISILKSLNARTKAGDSQDCVHLVTSHANDAGLAALHLDPLPRTAEGRAAVAETFYLIDLADSSLAGELKAAGKAVVYQGTHGDEFVGACDVLLPGATFVEKEGLYVNTEGRPQRSAKVYPPPGIAREDWKIIRAMGEFVGVELPYSDEDEMEERVNTLVPFELDEVTVSSAGAAAEAPKGDAHLHDTTIGPLVHDFYRTDAVSRASITMAKTSALHRKYATNWVL